MKYLFKELNNLKLGIFIIFIITVIISITLVKIELYTNSLLTTNLIPFIIIFSTLSISMLSAYNINNQTNNRKEKHLIFYRYFIYIIFVIIGILLGVLISITFLKFLNLINIEIKQQIFNCITYSIIASFLLRYFYHTM